MRQSPLPDLARLFVKDRYLLKPGMVIASYNQHGRLLLEPLERQGFQFLPSAARPQSPLQLQPLIQGQKLQLILDLGLPLHQLVTMHQQLPRIPVLR